MAPKTDKPTAKGMVSAAAAVAAAAMMIRPFVPYEFRSFLVAQVRNFLTTSFFNEMVVVVEESEGLSTNELFTAVGIYMETLVSPSARRVRATLPTKEKKIRVSLEPEEELADEFRGIKLKWRIGCKKTPLGKYNPGSNGRNSRSEYQSYELSFHRKYSSRVFDEYLPYVVETSKAAENERKSLKLYSNGMSDTYHGKPWKSVILDHPATFDTLAMDPDMKQMVIDDLDQFVARREVYRRMGKAWKRGYLLFGPPGTGKSSLIAAMANYLKFDVYDLELTAIRDNTQLRRLLISTGNKSIVVVEDIDCSIDLTEKRRAQSSGGMLTPGIENKTVTLSGLLNFNDGLWSSCGDEMIFVFTTNHVEKLDPALLRPGRMDVHIHMSYCAPSGFRLLASNYLGTAAPQHHLFPDVEREMATAKVTPAEIGELLLKCAEPDIAMKGLIQFLEERKKMDNRQVAEPVEETV